MIRILAFLILFPSIIMTAQVDVNGIVVEKDSQKPLEFAEVILLHKESSDIIGGVTNSKGAFQLNTYPDKYTLQIIYVGEVLFTKDITVKDRVNTLGTIEVVNAQELDEVIVTAKKKLIQRKIDRLVFNVEHSSKASEGDALEVLRVTPGVRVQNDNIMMIGKGNLRVMIDDKVIQLSGVDLANFLKSIASEDIKNIEVITTPPAKYEASGNSGLVNIILKKAKTNSWNAQIKSAYQQRYHPTGSIDGSFNYNKDKWSIATSFGYRQLKYHLEQDNVMFFPDGRWEAASPVDIDIEGANVRVDVNYQFTPNWEMGGQYYYNGSDFIAREPSTTTVFDYDTNEILRSLQSEGTGDQFPKIHTVNYNNEITLDTLGKKITMNLDYFTNNNSERKTYSGFSKMQNPFLQQFYKGINIYKWGVENTSVKLDIAYPLRWIDLDFGGKVSQSNASNAISFFNSGLVNEPVVDSPISRNDFEYQENIQALYLSANKKINDHWSTQIGLRMEATQSNATSNNLNFSNENDYVKIFPTFYLSYDATENSNFSFNYSKRIERPSFHDLNANMYFINPFQRMEGNAFLQPAFIDNLELTSTYKNFVTKFYYSYENNLFAEVSLPDATTNGIRTTYKNFINTNRIGFSENYTFDKIKWWSSNTNLDINYSESEFNLEQEHEDQNGLNATISTYNDFNLNSDKTFLMRVNYRYSFPGFKGVLETKSVSSTSVSLQYILLDKNMNITLKGTDLFKTAAERTTATVNGVSQTARYYYDSRLFLISVNYKFGNKKIKVKKHNTGNQDEKNRT